MTNTKITKSLFILFKYTAIHSYVETDKNFVLKI